MSLRTFYLVPFALCLCTAMAQTSPEPVIPKLMPQPGEVSVRAGQLQLTEGFSASLTGYSEPRLQRAVDRLYSRITAQTGIPLIYGTPTQQKPERISTTQR